MKQSILAILSALVSSMKEESQRYHAIIVPLIDSSVQVESPTRVYLIEEAMDLWATILVHTASPASLGIINLAQHLFPLYESASDSLRKALEITEIYILLIPQHFLSESMRLLVPFAALLGTTKREAVGSITNLVELLIQSANYIGGVQAVARLTTSLVSSRFLSTLLSGLHSAHSAHQTTGPKRPSSSIDSLVETNYLGVLARLALANPYLFTGTIPNAWDGHTLEHTMDWLLTEWLSHVDSIGDPERKKLSFLGLTNLVQASQYWILKHLQELMTLWTDTITELVDGDNNVTDYLIYRDEDQFRPDGPENPADERRRRLAFADPVHRLDAKAFLREQFMKATAVHGGLEEFAALWFENVDEDVLKGFAGLGVT